MDRYQIAQRIHSLEVATTALDIGLTFALVATILYLILSPKVLLEKFTKIGFVLFAALLVSGTIVMLFMDWNLHSQLDFLRPLLLPPK